MEEQKGHAVPNEDIDQDPSPQSASQNPEPKGAGVAQARPTRKCTGKQRHVKGKKSGRRKVAGPSSDEDTASTSARSSEDDVEQSGSESSSSSDSAAEGGTRRKARHHKRGKGREEKHRTEQRRPRKTRGGVEKTAEDPLLNGQLGSSFGFDESLLQQLGAMSNNAIPNTLGANDQALETLASRARLDHPSGPYPSTMNNGQDPMHVIAALLKTILVTPPVAAPKPGPSNVSSAAKLKELAARRSKKPVLKEPSKDSKAQRAGKLEYKRVDQRMCGMMSGTFVGWT